jgi:NAD(P)-dependent dehydrogenase (short-subunit alcohol dehydrogenase family)
MAIRRKPFAEQTIVVTGAASGIGLATACRAAARGADAVPVARNGDARRAIRDGILARGGRAGYVVADVGDAEDKLRVAAETPTRVLIVGGVGRAMIAASRLAPGLADRLFAWSFFGAARQPGRPPRATPDNLHPAGEDGKRHGDQGQQFDRSLDTAARKHPGAALGVLAAGAALVGVLAGGLGRSPMRS